MEKEGTPKTEDLESELGAFGVLEKAWSMLQKYPLCDYCLGRQFSTLVPGTGNRRRGGAIKTVLAMEMHSRLSREEEHYSEAMETLVLNAGSTTVDSLLESMGVKAAGPRECRVCGHTLNDQLLDEVASMVMLELSKYEFESFLVGSVVPLSVQETEDALRAEFGVATGEDIKRDINRELGKRIRKLSGVEADFYSPDVTVIVHLFRDGFELQVNPLFIKGSYRKFARNLPQSVWHCRSCRGKGCEECGGTGRKYPSSVSELIGAPAADCFEAADFKFHAAGREDVDAAVLGSGRPFVLEIRNPRLRRVDLRGVEKRINAESRGRIEVLGLGYSLKREARALKLRSPRSSKTYVVEVTFDGEVDEARIKSLQETFKEAVIEQRTPLRVIRRRSDRMRRKTVYSLLARKTSANGAEFRIRAQGGLYVKELITGDEGRTTPNVGEVLGAKPTQVILTVVDVEK